MGEKEETFSIRMGIEDFQTMEDFMAENGIKNRSRFIRDAIAAYICPEKQIPGGGAGTENGLFIHLGEIQLNTLGYMVREGFADSKEELIKSWIRAKIIRPEDEADSAARSFTLARDNSRMR